jgi:hypothetical protein
MRCGSLRTLLYQPRDLFDVCFVLSGGGVGFLSLSHTHSLSVSLRVHTHTHTLSLRVGSHTHTLTSCWFTHTYTYTHVLLSAVHSLTPHLRPCVCGVMSLSYLCVAFFARALRTRWKRFPCLGRYHSSTFVSHFVQPYVL